MNFVNEDPLSCLVDSQFRLKHTTILRQSERNIKVPFPGVDSATHSAIALSIPRENVKCFPDVFEKKVKE